MHLSIYLSIYTYYMYIYLPVVDIVPARVVVLYAGHA